MNDLKSSNWSDIQCFNFICGLIRVPTASSPTPHIPDIDQVLLYIFPPEFYDYTTGKSLSASQIVIRVYGANNVYTDYLISLQDFTIQESTLLTGINAQKPVFDYSAAEQKYLRTQSTYVYLEKVVNNNTTSTLLTYRPSRTTRYTWVCAVNFGENVFAISRPPVSLQQEDKTFVVLYNNESKTTRTWYLYVNTEARVVRFVSRCGNNFVIWVYDDDTTPTKFEGYVFSDVYLSFADENINVLSALYITGLFSGEMFEVDVSTITSSFEYLSANTFEHNNRKLAIVSNSYYAEASNSDPQIKFATSQITSELVETEYSPASNIFNVTDGIENNITYVDKSGHTFVLTQNQIALFTFMANNSYSGNCLFVLDIDTGTITLQNVTLDGGMWAAQFTQSNLFRGFIQDNLVMSQTNVITIGYASGSALKIFSYDPTNVSYSSLTELEDLSWADDTNAFSLFKIGSDVCYGTRDSSYELYSDFSYTNLSDNTFFNLRVNYNGNTYGVYKVTQCNNDLVLWINCSEGIVGLEFTSIGSSQSTPLSGIFTGYKYVIGSHSFIRAIKTFKSTNRLALWSYTNYRNNHTATHIIRPEVSQDTATIISV